MKYKLIKSSEAKIDDFGRIKVHHLIDNKNYDKLSINKVEINEEQKDFILNKRSDIFYYVIKGKGKFWIENEEFEVTEGDTVIIPKNIKYRDAGKMILLAISTPRFNSNQNKEIY